jgi:hypothetical protein
MLRFNLHVHYAIPFCGKRLRTNNRVLQKQIFLFLFILLDADKRARVVLYPRFIPWFSMDKS